jgi:spectinomycin phosphotransferase
MLGPPPIRDEAILSAVQSSYNLLAVSLAFLPRGNDAKAWVYSLDAENGSRYFLKLRRGINPSSLLIPCYLHDNGVEHLVPPLGGATAQTLCIGAELFSMTLYSFIEGRDGMDVRLAKQQWLDLGSTMRRIHSTEVPASLLQALERETFRPPWSGAVEQLDAYIGGRTFADPLEREAALYWRARQTEIRALVYRAEIIGRKLQSTSGPLVLCHGDIHAGNLLVDSASYLWIVDWDEVTLAPKERDLVFVVADDADDCVKKSAESWFFQGYGAVVIDHSALAYYRHMLAIGEVGDYGRRIFSTSGVDAETKYGVVEEFKNFFCTGGIVSVAERAGHDLGLF